ncbi:hypothetical protein GY45DRAFT_587773 [Cubamyces sp. BRFM 1775]|nr:hypothetical protein GY45DRAFT_587773 [Cubamyces sp. BRFM 1775]
MPKEKFYAVHNGRQGTQIYTTWEETKANVSRYSGAMHKSFRSLAEARAWLLGVADAAVADAAPPYSYPGASSSQASSSQEEPPTQYCTTQEAVSVKDEETEDVPMVPSQHTIEIDGPAAPSTQPIPPTAAAADDTGMNVDVPAAPELAPPQEIRLSPEQQHVLDMVKQGKSVFFTGSAGELGGCAGEN